MYKFNSHYGSFSLGNAKWSVQPYSIPVTPNNLSQECSTSAHFTLLKPQYGLGSCLHHKHCMQPIFPLAYIRQDNQLLLAPTGLNVVLERGSEKAFNECLGVSKVQIRELIIMRWPI